MNMNSTGREPFGEHSPDERRWQAQEKARRGDADADPVDLRVARALRTAPAMDLPVDFAARLAASVRAQAAAATLLEQRLLQGLLVVLALSSAVVVAWQGRGWAAGLAQVLPGGSEAVAWSGIAAACLLGNWGVGALRRGFAAGSRAGGWSPR
ncbi:MAG: hypothetical protein EOP93_16735 [Lysobacteraceae bacterium]|nr:MAG: hypothetical protein EOP93_16735 [Xanthomonadaceae bacterium]